MEEDGWLLWEVCRISSTEKLLYEEKKSNMLFKGIKNPEM